MCNIRRILRFPDFSLDPAGLTPNALKKKKSAKVEEIQQALESGNLSSVNICER